MELIIALVIGYVIGLLQNGITIKEQSMDVPKGYNKSIGLEEYTKYHDDTGGVNKF